MWLSNDVGLMIWDSRLDRSRFLEYKLSITIVTEVHGNESIEEYYALLNSSGLRLNRPELKKAELFYHQLSETCPGVC